MIELNYAILINILKQLNSKYEEIENLATKCTCLKSDNQNMFFEAENYKIEIKLVIPNTTKQFIISSIPNNSAFVKF